MRRMPTVPELEQFDVGRERRDAVDLGHGAVFVVFTLDCEDWTGNIRQTGFDVPRTECGIEPDVVPAPEGGINVAVIREQARTQRALKVGVAGGGDAGNGNVFDHDVRRHGDDAGHRAGKASRMRGEDECDRPAIAVSNEDWLADVETVEQFGKHDEGFLMHEIDLPRFGERLGLAVAVTGVDERVTAGGVGQLAREVLPHGDRAEPFVQQHERRCRRGEVNALDRQPAMMDDETGHVRERSRNARNCAGGDASPGVRNC